MIGREPSGRAVTSSLEAHGAGSPLEDGAGRAAVRRLRTPVREERDAGALHADAGDVGIALLADETRAADGWLREDVPATRAAKAGDAPARQGGRCDRQRLARGTRGTRSPAHAAGVDTAGRGDRHTRARPTARRTDLVRPGADAATDATGIHTARPDAELRRARAAIRRAARVEAQARVLAHTVVTVIRGTGIPIVALRVARAGLPG